MAKYEFQRDYRGYRAGDVYEMSDERASRLTAPNIVAEIGAGGGGLSVLEDPGNVWEQSTVVPVGYRIAVDHGGATHVFESTTTGTTHAAATSFDDFAVDEVTWEPEALTDEGFGVIWVHLGIVGDLSYSVLPSAFPAGVTWTQYDGLTIQSPYDTGDAADVIKIQTLVEGVPEVLFVLRGSGDTDWYLRGAGTVLWHASSGQSLFEISDDGVSIFGDSATPVLASDRATSSLGFFGVSPITQPQVAAVPTEQGIVDALVLLGLVSQAA